MPQVSRAERQQTTQHEEAWEKRKLPKSNLPKFVEINWDKCFFKHYCFLIVVNELEYKMNSFNWTHELTISHKKSNKFSIISARESSSRMCVSYKILAMIPLFIFHEILFLFLFLIARASYTQWKCEPSSTVVFWAHKREWMVRGVWEKREKSQLCSNP